MRKTLNPYMESFRRIALTVVVFVLAGSASLNAQGIALSTSKAKYTPGESITVNFAGGPGNPKDWIGLYRPDMIPGAKKKLGVQNTSIEVTDPPVIRDLYQAAEASFTKKLRASVEIAGRVVYADPPEACENLISSNAEALKGNIALVDRGVCWFQFKVQRAKNAGARAIIVVNNVGGAPFAMNAAEPDVTVDIPAVMITPSAGNKLKKHLTDGVHVRLGGEVGSLVWAYVGGTTKAGEGLTDGSVTFANGLELGDYKAIYFDNDGYGQLASTTFSVKEAEGNITILPLDRAPRKGKGLDGRYWQAGVKTVNNLRDTGLKIITGSHPTGTFKATHLTYQGGNDLTPILNWLRSRAYVGGDGNMGDGVISFTGYIRIDTPPLGIAPGEVTIRSESDDGSMVWIAGTKVVDNDGRHDAPGPTPEGTYNFETPGLYPIEIAWFNSDSTNDAGDYGDASLNVLVNGDPIPKGVLYREADVGAVAIAASSITEETGDAGLAGAYWHTDEGGTEFGEGPRVNSQGYWLRYTPIFQVRPNDDQGLMMLGTEPQGQFISTNVSYTGDDRTPILGWLGNDSKSFTGIEDGLEDALVQLKGFINIKKAGQHDFRCASDDGAVVWIGNQRVVDNDGAHGAPGPNPDGSAFFPVAGHYPIEVAWFNAGAREGWIGKASLSLKMDGRSIKSLISQPFAGADVPTLSIARNADGTLTVTFEGKLQGAPTVNGPWRDSGVTSPVTIRPTGKALFGRAVK